MELYSSVGTEDLQSGSRRWRFHRFWIDPKVANQRSERAMNSNVEIWPMVISEFASMHVLIIIPGSIQNCI